MDVSCADNALAARIAECPGVADKQAAAHRRGDLVSAAKAAGLDGELDALLAARPAVSELLDGVFSASPFLADLMRQDPGRLLRCLREAPENRLAALIGDLRAVSAGAVSTEEAMTALRRFRQELALLVALGDISGAWTIDEVTASLSRGADVAVAAAIDILLRQAAASGDFLPLDPENPSVGSGYIVLAMGKLGAGELNYSSDIDLIILYDAEAGRLREGLEPSKFYVRLTRNLVKLLQERTADGYVFRVDLRLRPDPGATAAAISLAAALQYYESMGQNWERAALIKARAMAGDIAAGEVFLRELAPFIWRKYFDFAAIADVHAMKRQIHAYKGHGRIAVAGHNIKLGRGGIREIEFFVQTQQLIAGGRQPVLRERRTLATLDRLVELEWISAGARDELAEAYRFLRRIEHRLQMRDDDQVYLLPEDEGGLDAFARFCALSGAGELAEELTRRMRCVESHYAALFEDSPELANEAGNLVFTGGEDDPDTLQTLSRMGYASPADIARVVRGWHFGRYAATRSEKARERLTELIPGLLKALSQTANPQAAFLAFDAFLKRLPAGVQVFSMLRANGELLGLLADIMGTAPRLAATLGNRASVLDAVLDPDFFGGLPSREVLAEHLETALGLARSYEEMLDRARRFGQEQAFLIGVRVLSGTISASQAGGAFAALAEMLVKRLHKAAGEELAQTHGLVPGGSSVVLALGKLGGSEITAASDLDLIVIYDFPEDTTASDGRRPLAPAAYYTRLTQRLIAAISAPTGEGTLYEVDMRLRPSGNAGPVAASLASFAAYQRDSAWTWEHMALTRGRVISGEGALRADVEKVIGETLRRRRDLGQLKADVIDMRRRIDEEKGSSDPWQIKTVPGGLVDLEFITQFLQLAHGADHPDILDQNTVASLRKLAAAGLLSGEQADDLLEASTLYHNLTQVLRLCLENDLDDASLPRGLQLLLARAAALPDFSVLAAHLAATQSRVREIFVEVLGAAPWRERR
ncbi:MAG: bifunctional [glutamine synthetase] adenylyltransferase/[glutamine synthetase]-adenylyl-L-tyrosine phosphorylase [Rhodobiaceae bacterium]|nr:bifunctional [glutamine synthetase] adenylyltransferase/[glutamine synthetase]-adenylyl-L-tyrosine phosphorylase [Rhodobiaceae bacterium]